MCDDAFTWLLYFNLGFKFLGERGGLGIMKIQWIKTIYASDLKSRAVLVMNYLIFRANNIGTCFPTIKTIAKECHISVNTVKRALDDLADAGFVKKESRFLETKNGAQTSNLYTLSIDTITKAEALLPDRDISARPAEPDRVAQKETTYNDDNIAAETLEIIAGTPVCETANDTTASAGLNITTDTTGTTDIADIADSAGIDDTSGMTDTTEATDGVVGIDANTAANINYIYPGKRIRFPATPVIAVFDWLKRSNVSVTDRQWITPTVIYGADDRSINGWAAPQPIVIPP